MSGEAESVRFRSATVADAEAVARLHAESWRRHCRGAYADSFLDGDVFADRRAVWSARLNAGGGSTQTILAEEGGVAVGFAHVVFDDDAAWGSLLDNLHVAPSRMRLGIGSRLLARIATAVIEGAAAPALYVWVLEQNAAAQAFYDACGGRYVGRALVAPPGGDPSRLAGSPAKLRYAWADPATLLPSDGGAS